jgi:hypothetical protein
MTVVVCRGCNCVQTFNYETRKCVLCKRDIDVVKESVFDGG